MDRVQYEKAEEVFTLALQKPSASDRAHFLDKACKDDPSLGAYVGTLLKAHAEAGTFLDVPVAEVGDLEVNPPELEAKGMEIGPYKICEPIGEGGFGVVYLAEQEEPVRRKVALKIIKPGMDTKQVVTRFEMERQALALMDHPSIAKVFDAGATTTGRPYFVMELVQGIPITDYCRQAKLSVPQRLKLFVDICHAVQHAHQKRWSFRNLRG